MKHAVARCEIAAIVRRAKAFIFDFDGTLVDSNPIKWRAFETCFADFPEKLGEIMAYCRSNNHVPRDRKFRYVYEIILRLPYTAEAEARLQERFATAATQQIIEAKEFPGAEQFLKKVRSTHMRALLSSTPHETLLRIVRGRGWRDYFELIQGAPVEKSMWLRRLLEERQMEGEDVVFFGDTQEDANAAQTAQCLFVAVGKNRVSLDAIYSIEDFAELVGIESSC